MNGMKMFTSTLCHLSSVLCLLSFLLAVPTSQAQFTFLTNNGTLKQTKDVAANAEFLHIADGATPPVAKYRGVDIVTTDNLGTSGN